MTKIIHQIFLNLTDKSMDDFRYDINSELWKQWCKEHDYEYMLHKEESFEKIRTPKDKEMSKRKDDEGRHKFMDLDWGKYIVINHYGGVYIDLDIAPTERSIEFLQKPFPLIGTYDRVGEKIQYKEINTQVLAFDKGCLRDCLDYCYEQYEIKSKMPVYNVRVCRFLLQAAGPPCFSRWAKKNKMNYTSSNFEDYFDDQKTLSWLPKKNKILL